MSLSRLGLREPFDRSIGFNARFSLYALGVSSKWSYCHLRLAEVAVCCFFTLTASWPASSSWTPLTFTFPVLFWSYCAVSDCCSCDDLLQCTVVWFPVQRSSPSHSPAFLTCVSRNCLPQISYFYFCFISCLQGNKTSLTSLHKSNLNSQFLLLPVLVQSSWTSISSCCSGPVRQCLNRTACCNLCRQGCPWCLQHMKNTKPSFQKVFHFLCNWPQVLLGPAVSGLKKFPLWCWNKK